MLPPTTRGGATPSLIKIDPAHRLQVFQGWGTSLCWWAKVAGGYPESDRERIADEVFDPDKGLGLNVVRYNIGGGENSHDTFLAYRAAVPGYEPAPGKWDWSVDANQRWMLAAAIRRGADHLEAFSNSPPAWMTVSGSVTGAVDGRNNLRPGAEPDFADYLTTVVQQFQERWHICFDTLEPMNEPIADWWKRGSGQEGCGFDRPAQGRILQFTAAALQRKRLATRLSAPDENQPEQALASFAALPASDQQAVAQINTHSYGGTDRVRLHALAADAAKPLWMSEYGDDDASGLTLSLQILADLKQLQPAAWVIWQVADAAHGWGLFRSNETGETCDWQATEKYAVFGQYTRFLRPGVQMLDVADDRSIAGWDAPRHRLSIVTTNPGDADRPLMFDLSAFGFKQLAVSAYRTSDHERAVTLVSPTVVRGMVRAVAAARSITTFIVTDAISAGHSDGPIPARPASP